MDRRPRQQRVALVLLAVSSALLLRGAPARAGGDVETVEREFKQAVQNVTPATVVCRAKGTDPAQQTSSGVIVSKKGLVLTDSDAGLVRTFQKGGPPLDRHVTDIEVRAPDEKSGFKAYKAHVLRRDVGADTILLRIDDPPVGGFPHVAPMGTSDALEVGDLVFAVGNSFGLSAESRPSVTSGVVASLTPLPAGDKNGRYDFFHTSAAVNPGVNGGPLVDLEGRLVGTVSTYVEPTPEAKFQFLGKVVPIDRLRAVYGDLPEAAELFPPAKPAKTRSTEAAALEIAYHQAAMKAYPAVASLVVTRKEVLSRDVPSGPEAIKVPRYEGPSSAVMLSADGLLVTSLYNLTNTIGLATPISAWKPPPEATVEKGLADITGVEACFADGCRFPAKVLGSDLRLGIALLQIEAPPAPADAGAKTYAAPVLVPAPPETFQEGRFVLALGNPFGEATNPSPLLTVGILSKRHGPDAGGPWRDEWQTDAGGTDGNCGGAVVDLEGRILGLMQIWAPLMHGRNSGIAFIVPWQDVLNAVPDIRAGKIAVHGIMGVGFHADTLTVVETVDPDSGAAKAGILPGDEIARIDGRPTVMLHQIQGAIAFRWAGEKVVVTVRRGGKEIDLEVVLTPRKP